MTDLTKLRQAVEDDEYIHIDKLTDEHGADPFDAEWVDEVPDVTLCVYCNAPWTPEMIELVELSGYCETCADAHRVIDVFCGKCERLVYRKEVR